MSQLFSISANAQDKKPLESNPLTFASLQKKALLSGFVLKQRKTIKFFDPCYAFLSAGSLFFFCEDSQPQKEHHNHYAEKCSN